METSYIQTEVRTDVEISNGDGGIEVRLNLGCGPKRTQYPGYVNVDKDLILKPDKVIDFTKDKRSLHEWVDNSVDEVRCENLFDSITKEQGVWLIREIHRVLKPGGYFKFHQGDVAKNPDMCFGWWELKDSCPYIIFCDADVQWKPKAFRLMQKAMEVRRQTDHHVAFAYGDYDRVGAIAGLWRARKFNVEELRRQNYISTMALVLTSALPNPPFVEDEERLQDWSLWLRMLNKGHTGIHVGATLFTAFYNDGSVSTRDIKDYEKWHNLLMERYVNNAR